MFRTKKPVKEPSWQRQWGWLVVPIVLMIVAFIRLRLLTMPLERDEGEYAYTGQLLLQGIPPYKLAYSMKFPGTTAAYALIMGLFGETPVGIHLGILCVTTLTALLLYWFGRRWLDETAGVTAATGYALLAVSPYMYGLAGHATHFCALFATAGLCVLWGGRQQPNWRNAMLSGILLGMALLMKQHAAFLVLWGLAAVAVWQQHGLPWGKRIGTSSAYCAGALLPLALTCCWLWQAGVIETFWFWTIRYAREYASSNSAGSALRSFLGAISFVTSTTLPLWLLAGGGVVVIWFDKKLWQIGWPILGFSLASFLTICPGYHFRWHYFLLLLPAIALLAGCAVSVVGRIWRDKTKTTRSASAAWPVCIYFGMLIFCLFQGRIVFFQWSPSQAVRTIYRDDPVVESPTVAAYIQTNSPPGAKIAVLGSEPQIYFLSHRHSATGYIYTYGLTENQPFAQQMQQEMMREIESAKPDIVVLVTARSSWTEYPESDRSLIERGVQSLLTNYDFKCSFASQVVLTGETNESPPVLVYQRHSP